MVPTLNIYNDTGISFFGLIVIAAIRTLSCADFQRDTIANFLHQTHLKVFLPWRSLGGLICRYCLCLFRSSLKRFWYLRPGPTIPSAPIIFPGICSRSFHRRLADFLLGSSSSLSPLSRKIFIVYLQGAISCSTSSCQCLGADRSPEHSGLAS
jgi:hypothetical protein